MYSKPEIAVLGDAVRAIQLVGDKGGTDFEMIQPQDQLNPAYDLDG